MIKPLNPLCDDNIKLEIMDNCDFIRTGIPMDSNCYYNAILYPFKYYRDYSKKKKEEYIKEKKNHFFKSFTIEEWIKNEKSLDNIIDLFRIIVYQGYIESDICDKYQINQKNYSILCDFLNTDIFDEKIIKRFESYKTKILESENQLSMMKIYLAEIIKEEFLLQTNIVEKNIKNEDIISNEKKNKIINILIENYLNVFNYMIDFSFNNFKENNETWLDISYFHNINKINHLDINVIFIDVTTGYPYKEIKQYEIDEEKPFIVILYFPDFHFETIGKKKDDKLYRIFNYNDPFIQKIINYIENQ